MPNMALDSIAQFTYSHLTCTFAESTGAQLRYKNDVKLETASSLLY